MGEEVLLVEKMDGYRVLTLNRPEKLNAFNIDLHIALRSALEDVASDEDCRAVMITGAGRGFCAGQDLGDRDFSDSDQASDLGATIEAYYNPLVRQIRALELPVVCVVNGVAAGAGANIALACDIVLAAKSARFIQSFAKIGLVPDSGGTWILPHLIGEARAKALALTATPVFAEQAEQWGMIWKAIDDEDLMAEAHKMMRDFAIAPTVSLGLTKSGIQSAATNTFSEQIDLERDLQREAGSSADYIEGVTAFLEKRQPQYTGKRNS